MEREPLDYKIVERGRPPSKSVSKGLALYALVVLTLVSGLTIVMIQSRRINEILENSIAVKKQVNGLRQKIDRLDKQVRVLRHVAKSFEAKLNQSKAGAPPDTQPGLRN